MLLFIIKTGHEEVKIIKGQALAYLTLLNDNLSDATENQERITPSISAATSDTKAEILPTIPTNSKMIFPVITYLSGNCYLKVQKYW